MDGGGGDGDVELAQPGPISCNYEAPEPEPPTWIDTAALCFMAVASVGMVAGGTVAMVVPRVRGAFVSETAAFVLGSYCIVMGLLLMALGVFLLKTDIRSSREVQAMTRQHMVPVSRR